MLSYGASGQEVRQVKALRASNWSHNHNTAPNKTEPYRTTCKYALNHSIGPYAFVVRHKVLCRLRLSKGASN